MVNCEVCRVQLQLPRLQLAPIDNCVNCPLTSFLYLVTTTPKKNCHKKALFQNKSIDGRNGTENEEHGRFTPWNFLDQSIDDPAITRFLP